MKPRVLWTPMHLEALEKAFPEPRGAPNVNELLVRVGQRAVVLWVKDKIESTMKEDDGSTGIRR